MRSSHSIAHAHIRPQERHAWHGPSLLVTDHRGDCGEGLSGFYFRETRYLSLLRLEVNGEVPWLCAEGNGAQDELMFTYTHPELAGGTGGGSGTAGDEPPRDARGLPRRALELVAIYRVRFHTLEIALTIANRSAASATVELAWRLDADYADLIEADAGCRQQQSLVDCIAEPARLRFLYRQPALPLETVAEAYGGEWLAEEGRLATAIPLERGQVRTLHLRVTALGDEDLPDAASLTARDETLAAWRERVARVDTRGSLPFGRMVQQGMDDLGSLALLEGESGEWLAPAAGIPLYPALFGRDSLSSTWQATVLDRGELLDATLTRLAGLQGTALAPERDEEPGRIIHSVRRGPLARLGLSPFGRYYADFASPFMFVISLAQLYAWTGDKRRIRAHWDTARRILDWAREYGDRDGDGYLEYKTHAKDGPRNQGWKDSGDGVVDEQGRQVPAPIATCEIQGYWYAAQQLIAVLSAALGSMADAKAYWSSAAALKERFNRDWWMPAERFFALALDPDKGLVRSITSNVGHCLASGIIADEHILPVVGRLFAPDLFSGWGIRTLSSDHPSYNPISYHLGSIWAVENATIAFGLRRYGLDARTMDLFEAMVELTSLYEGYRVPECVGGYARGEFPHPGAYPRANAPQAWNQSALPLFLQTILGLQPVAPLHLLAVDPMLPAWLPEVTIEGLRLGATRATLRFSRRKNGHTDVDVVRKRGPLHLVRQPPPESLTAGPADRLRAMFEAV